MKNVEQIKIKEIYRKDLTIEDAVILRNYLIKNIHLNDLIVLDYKNTKDCHNYFSVLLTNLLATNRKDVLEKLCFKNIDNYESFVRVFYGTAKFNL